MNRVDFFEDILCCPECKSSLDKRLCICEACDFTYQKNRNQLVFDGTWSRDELSNKDWLNSKKEIFKNKMSWLYPFMVNLLSPVAPTISVKKLIPRDMLAKGRIANLGCGTADFGPKVLNVDLANYKNVDIVASISNLPFVDSSLDVIINIAVLEHVHNPQQIVEEFNRVLRSGGFVICFIPFMQGIHASPFDFQRYAPEGIKRLFSDFDIISFHSVGPTSGLLWLLQEWIALVFSFGSVALYKIILPITWLLSPIKYLDFFLRHHPCSSHISSGYYFVARSKKQTF